MGLFFQACITIKVRLIALEYFFTIYLIALRLRKTEIVKTNKFVLTRERGL